MKSGDLAKKSDWVNTDMTGRKFLAGLLIGIAIGLAIGVML